MKKLIIFNSVKYLDFLMIHYKISGLAFKYIRTYHVYQDFVDTRLFSRLFEQKPDFVCVLIFAKCSRKKSFQRFQNSWKSWMEDFLQTLYRIAELNFLYSTLYSYQDHSQNKTTSSWFSSTFQKVRILKVKIEFIPHCQGLSISFYFIFQTGRAAVTISSMVPSINPHYCYFFLQKNEKFSFTFQQQFR